MDILKAASDKNLFASYLDKRLNLSSWQHWLTCLKVIHGLPLDEFEHETVKHCTGRDPACLPKTGFDEVLILAGRRSGKSRIVGLLAGFEAVLSGREKGLSAGEIPMVAVLSPTRNQSRIIHSYLKAALSCTPILKRELVEDRRESFVLKNGTEVTIMTGDPRTVRGFSVTCACVDEIAFFGLTEESKVRSDTELIRAIRPSLATTGGRLISVGSPYKSSGYAYKTYRRNFGNDESTTLVWNAASTFMNPTLAQRNVDRALEEDYAAASVEYCIQPGLFREDLEQIVTRELVEALVVAGRKELEPRSGTDYSAFLDMSGGRSDPAALAIGHKVGRKVILDHISEYKAPHNPYEVVARMTETLRRYGCCDRVVSDAYSAEWAKVAFASHGVRLRRASTNVWNEGIQAKNLVLKPKSVLYVELLPRLTSGEIELLDNETLIFQLCSLQRRTRSGGRDSIDHPLNQHDDVANCAAGVCDGVMQRRIIVGTVDTGPSSGDGVSPALMAALSQIDYEREMHAYEQGLSRQPEDHQAELRDALFRAGRTHQSAYELVERNMRLSPRQRRIREIFGLF
jgi:hypothetical protein